MKRLITFGLVLFLLASPVLAASTTDGGSTYLTSNVNSTTVPVQVIAVVTGSTYTIKPRSVQAVSTNVPVLCWPYSATSVPGAAPANAVELSPGQPWNDTFDTDSGKSLNWACVCAVACASGVTVDSIWRRK